MQTKTTTCLIALCALLSLPSLAADGPIDAAKQPARYKDPRLSVEERVEDLLARMSEQEKADQICQSVVTDFNPNNPKSADPNKSRTPYGSYILFANENLAVRDDIQKLAVEKTRLGIPAIFGADVIHGCFLTFPIPLAQACSWDPELARRSCSFAAAEARRIGIDWVFSPMIDIAIDPRWGRIAEGYGESPYGASVFAVGAVKGYQGATLNSPDTVACTLKHFVAYGASEGGRDYSYTDVSPVRLWELYLPPYEAAVKAGAASIMSSLNDLNGVPLTANHYLLTDVLRQQWGFKGVVVTDWGAISQLVHQGYAADGVQGLKASINAGVDIDMLTYLSTSHLVKLVKDGEVPAARVDEAVRRILRMKFALGMFEHPYAAGREKLSQARKEEGEQIAEALAEQSLVLLKNDGALPVSRQAKRIALIGPLAADKQHVLGSWRCAANPAKTVSLEEGLRKALPAGTVLETRTGCDIEGEDRGGIAAAVTLAKQSDLVILCLGEAAKMSGENASRSSLRLPGLQEELALAIAQTGKPVVLLLSSGRPLEIGRLEPKMNAIVSIWQPGTKTGTAVANVLLGNCNPSGRLAVTWPRSNGQIPIFHNMHQRARGNTSQGAYQDIPTTPQYEFGYGLSYTTFRYSPITLTAASVKPDGELTAEVTVTNAGAREGSETVFWFINDPVASISQPIKELKHFEKAAIPAGASRTFRFTIQPRRDLSFRDGQGNVVLEPGVIRLMAGSKTASFNVETAGGSSKPGK
jgi:beta-glucosidase